MAFLTASVIAVDYETLIVEREFRGKCRLVGRAVSARGLALHFHSCNLHFAKYGTGLMALAT